MPPGFDKFNLSCTQKSHLRGRLQTIFSKITSLWREVGTPLLPNVTLVRRRSPLLLTCHYPCVCRNTVRWTAHTELLDGHKLYLLSPEARCQTVVCIYRHFVGRQNVTWLAPLPPKRHNDVILEKVVWRRPLIMVPRLVIVSHKLPKTIGHCRSK